MEKERTSEEPTEELSGSGSGDELPPPQPPRRPRQEKKRHRTSRRTVEQISSTSPLDQRSVQDRIESAGAVGEVTNKLESVGEVSNTLGSVANNTITQQGQGDGALRLRLDLNLDVEIELKAKIHGDLTLALLLVMLPNPEKAEGLPQNSQPEITIPKIKPLESGESPSTRARGLVGKLVDEFGNILDWDGTTVLGCVEGDLPSMVGRPISASGEVLDGSGEVVGHVSEKDTNPRLKDLESGLKVDDSGSIYNRQGIIVGKMNDPSVHTAENSRRQASAERRGTGSSPSPSEVYLDVKSTRDGIQLIIKIPTAF